MHAPYAIPVALLLILFGLPAIFDGERLGKARGMGDAWWFFPIIGTFAWMAALALLLFAFVGLH